MSAPQRPGVAPRSPNGEGPNADRVFVEVGVPRSRLEAAAGSPGLAVTLQLALGRAVLDKALRGFEQELRAENAELRRGLRDA